MPPQLLMPQCCLPQIYPDPELEAQVLSLAIRCIHSEEGCRWSGLIKHLQVGAGRRGVGGQGCSPCPLVTTPGPPHPPQAHLGTCGFNVIPCPNRCSAKLSRRDLPEHVQHGCPKRRVKCEFCASDFTGEAFEVGAGGDAAPGGMTMAGTLRGTWLAAVLWRGGGILGWVARWVQFGDHNGLQGTVGAQRGRGDKLG